MKDVERVELGPQVVERIRAFEEDWAGGCGHLVDQWASVSGRQSKCLDCWRTYGPVAPWETGPCALCGRVLTEPTTRSWAVPSTQTEVLVCVRLCPSCTEKNVLVADELEKEDGMSFDTRGRAALRSRMVGKLWAGALTASAGNDLPCCEQCWTFTRAAAMGGVTDPLPLHRDCYSSLQTWASAARSRDRSTLSRAERAAIARAVLVLARAEVRP